MSDDVPPLATSPYAAITPRRSTRRAALGALTVLALFAAGWAARPLLDPRVALPPQGLAIVTVRGATTGVLVAADLRPDAWPDAQVEAVTTRGCLSFESVSDGVPSPTTYCDLPPARAYLVPARPDNTSAPDLVELADGGFVALWDDGTGAQELDDTDALPRKVESGENAVLLVVWDIDPASQGDSTDTQPEPDKNAAPHLEVVKGKAATVRTKPAATNPLILDIHLRSALGARLTESLTLEVAM